MNSDSLSRYWPVILLVLLGASLRMYSLSAESLWLDEALSWNQARLPLPALLDSIAADVHPPLYALLLHIFIALLGDSETALRLLSVICSSISIWLTWAVCRHLSGGERAAWIAALLCAISVFAIQYAQEARMYALLCCLALASMLSFVRLCYATKVAGSNGQTKLSRTTQLAYLLTTALLMYSHVYGLFIVIAQNVIMLLRYAPGWPQRPALTLQHWILLQGALGVVFLPWAYVLTSQVARVQTSFWIDRPELNDLLQTFTEYMGVLPALLLGAIAALVAVFVLLRPARQLPSQAAIAGGNVLLLPRDTALLLLVWLIIPIGLPYVLSLLVQPIFMPRYTIASSPAWFMLIATGISALPRRWLRNSLLGLLVVAMTAVLPIYYGNNTKTDWPAVVALVEDAANTGDLVLFHNPDVLVPWQYYQQRSDLQLQTVVAAETWQAAGVTDKRKPDIRPIASTYQQVWLVSGYDRKTAITELEIVRQLASVLQPLGGREFGAIRVFRFAGSRQMQPGAAAEPAKP